MIAVAAHGRAGNRSAVAVSREVQIAALPEGPEILTAGRFPEDRRVEGPGEEVLAVASQGHAGTGSICLEGLQFLAAGRLPQDCRLVRRPGDDVLAVAAQSHAPDIAGVSLEN